ncbi:MAG: hypothetical protein IPP44_11570 [Ideonella sp.]|nr:hypothetical protein [Ideonella sp.]
MSTAPETLRALLDRAYEHHAATPQVFAEALAARAGTLPVEAESAEMIRFATHLLLAHLADVDALQRLVQALPPALVQADIAAPSLQRAVWCMALVRGEPEPLLPPLSRWRSLHNVVLGLARLGRAPRAAELLARDEPAALSHAGEAERQAYAAVANDTALHLRTGERGSVAADELMIHAAEIARRAWERAGTWLHVERAEYQLALCHATAGHGAQAIQHAQWCLEICKAQNADALEHFFAHEALVLAHRAAGDIASARAHREQMVAWLPKVADADMRAWCTKTLDDTPA